MAAKIFRECPRCHLVRPGILFPEAGENRDQLRCPRCRHIGPRRDFPLVDAPERPTPQTFRLALRRAA